MALSRRTFLRASGVSLALPLLESMGNDQGDTTTDAPMRSVFICTTLGLYAPALFPNQPGKHQAATEYLQLLQPHRDEFTLFSGLSHPDQQGKQGHETEMTWLSAARNPGLDGFRNSQSVDQFAAKQLGYVTRFPSVRLSSDGPRSQSYTRGGVMLPAEFRPSQVFAKMFLQGRPEEVAQRAQELQAGRSILDHLQWQTKRLQQRSSTTDRAKLDQYFESVRLAERELTEAEAWLARPKPVVDAAMPADVQDKSDLIGRIQLLMRLVPLILQTDSSRVVSIVIQDHQSVPQVDGVAGEHHNLSHHGQDPQKIEQLKRIESSVVGCFGDLLTDLKAIEEAGQRLLDRTMVLFGSNLGNANAHDPRNLPILFAGGGFEHGNYRAFDPQDNRPLCNLFVTMLQRMSIECDAFATSDGTITI